ncbi:MAG: (Fe-S)-binding protein [Deltaproteobacteria bacterium]|nr:MAG: (Fe-S)-binding protein [Deltaproteobacteria bacterium]
MNRVEILENLKRCARCGKCRAVCPLVAEEKRESSGARGKVEVIQVMEEGLDFPPGELSSFFDNCLLCGRCEVACPNRVETVSLFAQARSHIAGKQGLPLGKRAFLAASTAPGLAWSIAAKAGNAVARAFLEKIPSESGIFYRIPSFLPSGGRLIPRLPGKSFLDEKGVSLERGVEDSPLLFTGCVFNHVYPEVLVDAVRHLEGAIPPREQTCCGLPAYAAGDMERAYSAARKNISIFSRGSGPIYVPCASCLYTLREVYPRLFAGSEMEREAREFSARILPLEEALAPSRFSGTGVLEGVRVAFHRPCHLKLFPKVISGVYTLLEELFGDRLVRGEWDDACCGFGGTFNISNYATSSRMGERKIALAAEKGVDIILTSCSGCIHHLRESAARSGFPVKVLHLSQVVPAARVDT